jgi:formate-dependent nitrite reductase membrane component NrfD
LTNFTAITQLHADLATMQFTLTMTCVGVLVTVLLYLMNNPSRDPRKQDEQSFLVLMTGIGSLAGVMALITILQ